MIDFNLDIYEDFILENYDYNEGKNLITECRNYLSENTNKGNIVSKIFNVIKRFIKWIIKHLKYLLNILKSLFDKGTSLSPEQILIDLKIISGKSVIKESFNYKDKIKPYLMNIKEGNITIFRFEKDNETEIDGFKELYKFNSKYYKLLFNTFKEFLNTNDSSKLLNVVDVYLDKHYEYDKKLDKELKSLVIEYSKIDNMQQEILDLSLLLSQLENDSFDISNFSAKEIDALTFVQNAIISSQVGMNELFKILQLHHVLDDQFIDKISSLNNLGFFIEEMIKNRYSGKSILMNSLKVYKYYNINDDYHLGTGRIVIIPINNKNYVHKIAYNGLGIKSNKNEIKINILNINNNLNLPFAKLGHTSSNRVVIEMENIKGVPISKDEIIIINKLLKNNKFMKNRIVADIHQANVLKTKDGYKIIDYGNIHFVE